MAWTSRAVGGAAALLIAMGAAAAGSSDEGAAGAQGGTVTKQKSGTYEQKNIRTVTVTVKEVDSKHHKVTFEATVKPEATTSSGRPIKLDQLREGDTIRAAFDAKTGEVVRIDITPAKEK
jgi:Cu/Ag efflux protein CusF